MVISNFIWFFFSEVINNSDNNPTKISVLMYAYFQMLYNFGTLFEKNGIQSTDRVNPLKDYENIKKNVLLSNKNNRCNLLKNYLYIGHNAFLNKLYKSKQLTTLDYGFNEININNETKQYLINWSQSHLTNKSLELERAGFATKNTSGLPADYTGSHSDNKYWQQLIVPTGVVRGLNNLPLIDKTNPLSFKIQNFLGINFYLNNGFAVNPTKNIINLDNKISKTWETGLKNEIDKLLEVYKNLDDNKKMIAELFAGSSKNCLPPPGFFICIAMQLSQKYNQTILNDLKMYFSLAAGLFDAAVSAWYYKSTYNQARPINLIRNNYTKTPITTWTPLFPENINAEINGEQWLPYQSFNFVTPPFPDVASGHTTFSKVAGKILDWWFKNPVLFDGFSLATIPNQQYLCPSLNINDKTACIGEFIMEKGSSTVEPTIEPKEKVILRYKTLDELSNMAGLSRIYGGIHTFQTNTVSGELGDWVFSQTIEKLIKEFKFRTPY